MGNKLEQKNGFQSLQIGGLCYAHHFKRQNGTCLEIDTILVEHYVHNLTNRYDSVDDFVENYSWKNVEALDELKNNQLFEKQTYSVHLDTGALLLAIVEVKKEHMKMLTKEEVATAALQELKESIFDLSFEDITAILAEELEI